MALFVQIDHFRKTDQKPTVKIICFQSVGFGASIVHPFNNNWNSIEQDAKFGAYELQSYILSTTTETRFLEQTNDFAALQSYILSTTTETECWIALIKWFLASIVHPFNNNWNADVSSYRPRYIRFNRTSFQQQLKHSFTACKVSGEIGFNRTSFQQQLKHRFSDWRIFKEDASIVHPFNNNWNEICRCNRHSLAKLQSYILSTTTETFLYVLSSRDSEASIVHPFNNNWNYVRWHLTPDRFCFNRTSFQQQLKRRSDIHRYSRLISFNRTSFQQQLKHERTGLGRSCRICFNRTSFQQQLKQYLHNPGPTRNINKKIE